MNIACIIPARGGSKGLPNKNILPFAGKPLINWSIDQAIHCPKINCGVYVTSDSDEILSISSKNGATPIKRPDDLSNDIASSESALIHAFDEISKNKTIDAIVFLQVTSPLRGPDDIEKAITTFQSEQLDSLFSASTYEFGFLWKYTNQNLTAVNYDYKSRKRRQDITKEYIENGSIYVFKPDVLTQHKNRLGDKIGLFVMEPQWKLFEIDNLFEFELCEFLFIKNKLDHIYD